LYRREWGVRGLASDPPLSTANDLRRGDGFWTVSQTILKWDKVPKEFIFGFVWESVPFWDRVPLF